MDPYIPQTDAGLESWALNFKTLLAASPTTYGLTSGNATSVTSSYTAWHSAYVAAADKPSRTKTLVQAKTTAKTNLLALVRPFAQTIRNNPAVLDSDKVAIGVTVPGSGPSPIPAPVTEPVVTIRSGSPLRHTLAYADSSTPDSRRKPFGARLIEIRASKGTTVGSDPAAASVVAIVGRQPVQVDYDSADRGKIATYFGRWVTATGLAGPWSAPVAMAIP
jgi:hypothetical protein